MSPSLRAQALDAERAGNLVNAIDLWAAIARDDPGTDVEKHLVALRIAAADAPRATPGSPVAIPPDPFPATSDSPPETRPDTVNARLLAGALHHHGSLLVRSALPRTSVDRLVAAIEHSFAERAALGEAADAGSSPWFAPSREWENRAGSSAPVLRAWTARCNAMLLVDSPRAFRIVTDALIGTGLVDTVAEYLGERPVLSAEKTSLRRIPPEARASWHQDGSFMGAETRAVNVWIALTDCGTGTDAPGLHVVPRRVESIVPFGTDGNLHSITVSPEHVRGAQGSVDPCTPFFAAGDALVFDQLLLHATGGEVEGLTRPRLAIEAWLLAPSTFPDAYVPVYL